ncbi:hypothetical protein H0A66_02905 [Alcaligenaceae bacterium]|nr:hypothetical protein [Alcaligenaceae bacterium]
MHQRFRVGLLYGILLAVTIALGFGGARAIAQQPVGAFTQGQITGIKWLKPPKKALDKPYTWWLSFHFPVENTDDIPYGGVAAFSLLDSGEIFLMNHTEYVPNLSSVLLSREIYPPNHIFKKDELPRFIMTCAWPLDEDKKPVSMIYTYAERDDSRFEIKDVDGAFLTFDSKWTEVPAKRVRSKFATHDYCGEISKTKKSSAPLWLSATKY